MDDAATAPSRCDTPTYFTPPASTKLLLCHNCSSPIAHHSTAVQAPSPSTAVFCQLNCYWSHLLDPNNARVRIAKRRARSRAAATTSTASASSQAARTRRKRPAMERCYVPSPPPQSPSGSSHALFSYHTEMQAASLFR